MAGAAALTVTQAPDMGPVGQALGDVWGSLRGKGREWASKAWKKLAPAIITGAAVIIPGERAVDQDFPAGSPPRRPGYEEVQDRKPPVESPDTTGTDRDG